jgi:dTDP-4-dehydrorhamnose reductase
MSDKVNGVPYAESDDTACAGVRGMSKSTALRNVQTSGPCADVLCR